MPVGQYSDLVDYNNLDHNNADDLQAIRAEVNPWVTGMKYVFLTLVILGFLALLFYGAYTVFGVAGVVVLGIIYILFGGAVVYYNMKRENQSITKQMQADGL